jgi:hypothetical protein
VKPKKPVNNKSNSVQGPVCCSPPPNLILNPKSSECLPSTPNSSSSQSFTPQKTCSTNIPASLAKDLINEDPVQEQDSIFDTPVTKITTSEEIFLSSKGTGDENTENDNPISFLEDDVNIFEFSQENELTLDSLSQLKISPVRSTNSLVPSLKANKHSNINPDISTQFSFPAKSLLTPKMSKSKSRLPVPLRVEKTKDSPRETRRTKQKPTCQSENVEVINGDLPLGKSKSKNKTFSPIVAAKKRKYPENGENNNQSVNTGSVLLSHCTPKKLINTALNAPLKKNQLPKDATGKKKSKDTGCAILSHCTPEKVIKKALNTPLKEHQLLKDDRCFSPSTVSTSAESLRQKKWTFVLSTQDSPVKMKQNKPKKKLFLCGSK